jgi:predicted SAM-dependent methyltransferase
MRLIFRGGGGNSFDDAQSYTQCCKIAALEKTVKKLESGSPGAAIAPLSRENSADFTPVPQKDQRLRGAFIHAGCGPKIKEGYYGCDIRKLPNVTIVCEAWNMHHYFVEAKKIYSRHMLEHLTFPMLERTLRSWFECLAFGGRLELSVPNMDDFIEKWRKLEWTADEWREPHSHLRHIHAGFWGWQTDSCSRTGQDEGRHNYWDCHKSGFNSRSLAFFLRAAGFSDIVHVTPTEVVAAKLMHSGERQVAMCLKDIRADHVGRYRYAASILQSGHQPGLRILDAACGIGYGSWLLAHAGPDMDLLAVDLDKHAVAYGREFYHRENIRWLCRDISALALEDLSGEPLDAVISFETLEHLPDPGAALRCFYTLLKQGGRLICSVPNELITPFSVPAYPFHFRHYTPKALIAMLEEAGFSVEALASQRDKEKEDVRQGTNGKYLIAMCRK